MDLLSLLFPPRCLGCKEIGTYLCPHCVNLFFPMYELYCPICRKLSLLGNTHYQCRTKYSIDGVMSGYAYSGLMMKAVTKFKYSFVHDLTKILVELLASGINHPQLFKHTWVIVPVPLHSSRLKWRGFNQAESLAVGLGVVWHNPVDTTLVSRIKPTTPQMKLSGIKRKQNLKNAFKINDKISVPSRILLVDDVATTCSTLNECAIALKKAGAKEVWGLTLAQKIPDR